MGGDRTTMPRERPTPHDRITDEVACVRCLEVKELEDLDRLLWCDRCRRIARQRASRWGWLIGLAVAACVALYIWLVIHGSRALIGGWAAAAIAAAWLAAKVGRELVYGVMRYRNTPALEAPPSRTDT